MELILPVILFCVLSFFWALFAQLGSCRKRKPLIRKLIIPMVLILLLILSLVLFSLLMNGISPDTGGNSDETESALERAGAFAMLILMVYASFAMIALIPASIIASALLGCLLAWIIFGILCLCGKPYRNTAD